MGGRRGHTLKPIVEEPVTVRTKELNSSSPISLPPRPSILEGVDGRALEF